MTRFFTRSVMAAMVLRVVSTASAEHVIGGLSGWATFHPMAQDTVFGNLWNVTVTATASGDNGFKFTRYNNWNNASERWGYWDAAHTTNANNSTVGQCRIGSQSGDNNLTFTGVTAGKRYTFRLNGAATWWDRQFTVQETSGDPVSVVYVGHNYSPTGSLEGPVTVTIQLSAVKNPEENIWVRYTTDNWATTRLTAKAGGSSTNYTASIPAQPDGTVVAFYVLTSTYASNLVAHASYTDLVTLRGNNGGSSYSYKVFAPRAMHYTGTNNVLTTVVGATNIPLHFNTYQSAGGGAQPRSWATIFMKWNDADLRTGSVSGPGRDPGSAQDLAWAYSPQFTQPGTWYWAMRVSYQNETNYWVVSSNSTWQPLVAQPSASTLIITAADLPESTGCSAGTDPLNPATRISLAWTRPVPYNVLIIRRAGSAPTQPTQAAGLNVGDSAGGGVVVYKGTGAVFTDSGLAGNTTYHYGFFTEFNQCYSPGVVASATTESPAPPGIPAATAASGVDFLAFTANWNHAFGADSYRIDVAATMDFGIRVAGYDNRDVGFATSCVVTGLPGVGIYYYRVRAANGVGTSGDSNPVEVRTRQVQARNSNGSTNADVTPAVVYLGDTVTFGVQSWGSLNGNWGAARLWTHTNEQVVLGVAGPWGPFVGSEIRTRTAIASWTGQLFWAMQVDYGMPYGTNFWYVQNTTQWVDMGYAAATSGLRLTVQPIPPPTGLSIAPSALSPGTALNLTWTKAAPYTVMIIRSTNGPPTMPPQGVVYNVGSAAGGGQVVYRGANSTFSDTGLQPGMTYEYGVYSENNAYRSTPALGSGTTVPEPVLMVSPGTLDFASIPEFSVSTSQNYTVSGFHLTGSVRVYAPYGFAISLSSSTGFVSGLTLNPVNGTLDSTTIYTRFLPSVSGAYSGWIQHFSASAASQNKQVQGVATEVLTLSPNHLDFGSVAETMPVSEQSYQLSATNLPDTLTILAPEGFAVSLTPGSGYASSLTLTPTEGVIDPLTIYVMMLPGPARVYYDSIVHSSSSLVKRLYVAADIRPSITVHSGYLSFGNLDETAVSDELSYRVSATNLSAPLILTAPAGAEISLVSGSGYASSLNLQPLARIIHEAA